MTRIAITGAAGNVGRAVKDAFGDDQTVVLFTHSEHEDLDSQLLDVTDPEAVTEELDDFDVVIHLAGASSPTADWDAVESLNVEGTKHVLDAAVENDIDRVVYASSNHAVGSYNTSDDDPESMRTGDVEPVGADAPVSPDSFYGVSKAAAEGLTRFYANTRDLEVVNLRIGWYMSEDDLEKEVDKSGDPGRARFARATWLSPRDCRAIHRQAATASLSSAHVTVNAISRNDDRYFSLIEAIRALDYRPRDNAAEVLDD